MNFALRCMPPTCIAQQAAAFDALVMDMAQAKLLLHSDERASHPPWSCSAPLCGSAASASPQRSRRALPLYAVHGAASASGAQVPRP